jgi:predicted nucleic acid-binding protein
MKAVIDSDILIDYLQGINAAKAELARYRRPLYSVIALMELLCGAQNDNERAAAGNLLGVMERVEISEAIARRAVEVRKHHRLKLPDAIVLASAEEENCLLVTRNTKGFPRNHPHIRFPYTV